MSGNDERVNGGRIGLTDEHYRHYCAFCGMRIPEKNQECDTYWDWKLVNLECPHCGRTTTISQDSWRDW